MAGPLPSAVAWGHATDSKLDNHCVGFYAFEMTDFSSGAAAPAPDHHTQLEDLLGHVLRCETWERLGDRIDLSLRVRRESPADLPGSEG